MLSGAVARSSIASCLLLAASWTREPFLEIRALVVESIGAAKKAVEDIIQFVP